jgi:hypothetical protein
VVHSHRGRPQDLQVCYERSQYRERSRRYFLNGAPVFSNILSSNANIEVHFHFRRARNPNFEQTHFIHSLGLVLPKSLQQLHPSWDPDTHPSRHRIGTIGADWWVPTLKLTVVLSARVELRNG